MTREPLTDEMMLQAYLVSDALVLYGLFGAGRAIHAELRGTVTFVSRRGGVIFAGLQDTTGTIQILGERGGQDEDTWSSLKRLKQGHRVSLGGRLIRSEKGRISVIPEHLEPSSAPDNASTSWHRVTRYGRVARQLFLARVCGIVEEFFREREFLQLHTNLILSSWHSEGIEPLQVVHAGFGLPTYLTTSAHSQLIDAADLLAQDRLFTVGRCFSNTVIDERSSMEAPVLSALVRTAQPTWCIELTMDAIDTVLREVRLVGSDEGIGSDVWGRESIKATDALTERLIEAKTVQQFAPMVPSLDGDRGQQGTEISRRPAELVRFIHPPDIVLAEIAVRTENGDSASAVSLSIFLERFLPVFREISVRDLISVGLEG